MYIVMHRRSFLCGVISLSAASSSAAVATEGVAQDRESQDQHAASVPQLGPRSDLSGNINADRPLSLADLDLMLKLSDHLISTATWSGRVGAARDLGRLGHKYGIPALLAVARDKTEQPGLRAEAIVALTRIRDKRVVDFLIEEALGRDPDADNHALDGLIHLVGKPPELHDTSFAGAIRHPPDDPKEREEYLNIWRKWWKKNRDTIELGRGGGTIYW